MKRKIFLLITGCIVTVVALAAIQGYFIYNTYKLQAREANIAITQEFLKLETSGKLDSLNHAWMRRTERFIALYNQKLVTKKDYQKLIKKTSDSLSGVVSNYISKKGFFDNYEVNYTNYIVSAVLFKENDKVGDTLFKGKQLLFGNNTENTVETQASQSTWRGNTNQDEALCRNEDDCRYFEIITERFYSIPNWQSQIVFKMTSLLGFSVLLLAFVVLLFYWSIKNLITQKKIADIKTDFINNITHEFQTPLAALDIAVMTLKKKDSELTPEQHATTLSIIDRQNHRMQKLFRQVTDASLTADMIVPDSKQSVTWEEICHILDDFSFSHPTVTINCTIEDEKLTLSIDRFHLSTILVNLLDNAVKYGANAITITMEKTSENISLSVKDNGMGIPEKEHRAIFDKFYRVEKGNIHTAKGLGLGLFYVRQIAEAYKGSITVSSEAGKGAAFTLTLPSHE